MTPKLAWWLCVGAGCVLTLAWFARVPSSGVNTPSLSQEWDLSKPLDVQLGELQVGTVIDRKLYLVNRSAHSLVVSTPRVSCGCLSAEFEHEGKPDQLTLAPGERVSLQLVLRTTGLDGPFRQVAYIPMRDVEGVREAVLGVRGTAVSLMQAIPDTVDLGLGTAATPRPFEVVLTEQPGSFPANSIVAMTTSPVLKVVSLSAEADSAGKRLLSGTIRVPEGLTEASGQVLLMTKTGQTLCTVRVRATSPNPVVATPSSLSFPSPDAESRDTTTISFEATTPVRVRLAEPAPEQVAVEVQGLTATVRVTRYPQHTVRTGLQFEIDTADGHRHALRIPLVLYPTDVGVTAKNP